MATRESNCTVHLGNISDGACNTTTDKVETSVYDSVGAMQFIVVVIVVYGVAVVGVFVLGHFRRKGKLPGRDLDKQANSFLKQMPTIRSSLEKQQRLCSIHQLFPDDTSYVEKKRQMLTLGDDVLKYISIPLLTNETTGKMANERSQQNQGPEVELRYVGTFNERSSSGNSWSEVIKEVDETSDDLEDDVFMNSRERSSLGVDIYMKV